MKNRIIKASALMLALTMITTCFVGGTLAKYTTTVSGSDSARVAHWGFNDPGMMVLDNLFSSSYMNTSQEETVKSATSTPISDKVIAPGTAGNASFGFQYNEAAPEVAYKFSVEVYEICDVNIKNNPNIQWKLDNKNWGTWETLIADIKALSGAEEGSNKVYQAGELPAAFSQTNTTHTIYWQWLFEHTDETDVNGNDPTDTDMGNAAEPAECTLTITITAEQID